MYRITTNLAQALIEVELEGFWAIEEVPAFAAALREQVNRLALAGKRQRVLYDFTRAAIQNQEVVGAFQAMARANDYGTPKVALFSAGKFARLQAQRVASAASDRFRVFDDRDRALGWLNAG